MKRDDAGSDRQGRIWRSRQCLGGRKSASREGEKERKREREGGECVMRKWKNRVFGYNVIVRAR